MRALLAALRVGACLCWVPAVLAGGGGGLALAQQQVPATTAAAPMPVIPSPDAATPAAPPAPASAPAVTSPPPPELERGLVLFRQRDYAGAAAAIEQARTAAGAQLPVDALLMLGICYYRIGDLGRAEPLLARVAREGDAETSGSAGLFLSLLYREQGAIDQAGAELSRVVGSPYLRESAQRLLQQGRPHRLYLSALVSAEFDGNVPLTDSTTWRGDPNASADGDLLFLFSLSVRPLAAGLTIGNTLSYRQQLRLFAYDLLLNSTWLNFRYAGRSDRVRVNVAVNYALLGTASLFVDVSGKFAYRRRLRGELGVQVGYDARYRSYLNSDYMPLSGLTQTLQLELGYGVAALPVTAGIGYQGLREQTRAPADTDPPDEDYRAWAHGPYGYLRARLHPRLELSLQGSFLQRIFDYVPGADLPQLMGQRRVDLAVYGELSFTATLTRWLDLFFGGGAIYNSSNRAPFDYVKPTAFVGLSMNFGLF